MRSSQRHKETGKAMECKKTEALRDGTKYETTVIVVQRNPKEIKMAACTLRVTERVKILRRLVVWEVEKRFRMSKARKMLVYFMYLTFGKTYF